MFLLPLARGHLFLGKEGRKDEAPFLLFLTLSYLLPKLPSSLKDQKDLLAISVLGPDARKSWDTKTALEEGNKQIQRDKMRNIRKCYLFTVFK